MRHIAFLFLLFPFALSAQEDCDVFNIQGLAAEILALHDSIAQFSVDTVILQPDGSFEVQLSNGTTFTQVQGCTDPAYPNYEATANTNDGSCSILGCSDSDFASMDGHNYELVTIGYQCWFAENLRTTVYADGTAIPEVTDDTAWAGLSTGARCDYDNDASNVATYGRLYNWYAATDDSELCPTGWHVPTDGEWTALETYLGANGHSGTEGTALKSTSGWNSGGNGTDDFGFSALPGGLRYDNNGNFNVAGYSGYWWSSSPSDGDAWARALSSNYPDFNQNNGNPRFGWSVRCLRDADFAEVQGCTDPAYTEYEATANTNDGSCATPVVEGCTDSDYQEYDASANTDDGSCSVLIIPGCTDPDYAEYDATATLDDGSCQCLIVDPACVSPTMDGHSYDVVQIGCQCWFAENLRTTVYADGTAIPEVTYNPAWAGLSTGARCDYYNDASNVATYGRLYNWYAVADDSELCPTGWHVPTDGEWTALETYLGANGHSGTEGTALKSTSGWYDGGSGTDDFGFSALPGGFRNYYNGYNGRGDLGRWWSSSPVGGSAWYRYLFYSNPDIEQSYYSKLGGFSVRCLRDAE